MKDVPVEVQNYEFEMDTLKVGDYMPVAIIVHKEPMNQVTIIKNDEQEQAPAEWWSCKGHCDDCHDKYLRQKTIILKNAVDGTYKQVGTGCVKKYTGIDCNDIISVYGNITEFVEDEVYIDEADYHSGSRYYYNYVLTKRLLAACIDVIKKDGAYRSYSKFNRLSTIYQAQNKVSTTDGEESIKSFDEAQVVIDYFKELAADEDRFYSLNDFFRNVCSACISKYSKDLNGFVACGYVAYQRLTEKDTKEESKTESSNQSEYVGSIGDKLTIDVKFEKMYPIYTQYGASNICVFIDKNNNQLVWTTLVNLQDRGFELGANCKITGTVKNFKIYNGTKQTVITRVKRVA